MAISKIDYDSLPLFTKQRTSVSYGTITATTGIKHWHASDFDEGKSFPLMAPAIYSGDGGIPSIGTGVTYYPAGLTLIASGRQMAALAYLNVSNLVSDASYVAAIHNHTSSDISGNTFTFDCLYVREDQIGTLQNDYTIVKRSDTSVPWTGAPPLILYKRYAIAYTNLAKNSGKTFTKDDVGFLDPPGYRIFGITGLGSGSANVGVSYANPHNYTLLGIRNSSTASQSNTAYLCVTYIKEEFVQNPLRAHINLVTDTGITATIDPNLFPIIGEDVTYTVTNPNSSYEYTALFTDYGTNVRYGQTPFEDSTLTTERIYGYTGTWPMSDRDTTIQVSRNAYTPFFNNTFFQIPAVSIATNGTQTVSKTDVDFYIPSGYIPIPCGVSQGAVSSRCWGFIGPYDGSTTNFATIRNIGSSASNIANTMTVNFIDSNLVQDLRGT